MAIPRIVLEPAPTLEEFYAWLAPMRASRQFRHDSALRAFLFEWGAAKFRRIEVFVEAALYGCTQPTLLVMSGMGRWTYSVADTNWPKEGFRSQEIPLPEWVDRVDAAARDWAYRPYVRGGSIGLPKREAAGPIRRIVAKMLEEERVTP